MITKEIAAIVEDLKADIAKHEALYKKAVLEDDLLAMAVSGFIVKAEGAKVRELSMSGEDEKARD